MTALHDASSLPDAQLDLRGTPCPLNFVRAKLRLQQLEPGSRLEIWLDPGEPVDQVPEGLTMAGYHIEALVEQSAGYVALLVRCPMGQS